MTDLLYPSIRILYYREEYSRQEQLAAIRQLQEAPPLNGPWNHALVMALGIDDHGIQQVALDSCLKRLEYLEERNRRVQSDFLGNLIQFCLMERDKASENIRVQAMETIAQKLEADPLKYAHHLRHLLSLTRSYLFITGQGKVAEVITTSHRRQVADKSVTRSDILASNKLLFHRRWTAYSDIGASPDAVLSLLQQDQELTLAELSRQDFREYQTLLVTHVSSEADMAIRRALGNLSDWLKQLPQTLETRSQHTPDMKRAALGVSWTELHQHAYLHLAAHAELLPGIEQESDLLRILETRYSLPEYSRTFEAGLDVLAYLPELRYRMGDLQELCTTLLKLGQTHTHIWEKVFDVIGSLVIGLPEISPIPESATAEEGLSQAKKKELARIREARRQILCEDTKMRQFLYAFSQNRLPREDSPQLHYDIPQTVRLLAWKELLRALPPQEEMYQYLQEALLLPTWSDPEKREFFWETLQIAVDIHQRQAWELLQPFWKQLIAPAAQRHDTIQRLCDAFVKLKNSSAVSPQPDGALPPLIALALDDDDPPVREMAQTAIEKAGYGKELARERTRRDILQKTNQLSEIYRQIIAHEQERDDTQKQIESLADEVLHLNFEIQLRRQRRQLILTEHYLETAQLTIRSQQILNALAVELQRADKKDQEVQSLARQVEDVLNHTKELEQNLKDVERRFQSSKEEIRRWEEQIVSLDRDIVSAESALRSVQHSQPPSRPPSTGDPAIDEERKRHYENVIDSFERQKKNAIESYNKSIKTSKKEISKLRAAIGNKETEVTGMEGKIRDIQTQQGQLQKRRVGLDQDYAAQARELERIYQAITDLRYQHQQIQRETQATQQANNRRLNELLREIEQMSRQKEKTLAAINQLEQVLRNLVYQINNLRTGAQQLRQDIENLREHWERLAVEARAESALAEQTGHAAQEATRAHVQNEQESLLWYAYEISQARRYQPAKVIERVERERDPQLLQKN